MRKGQRLEVEKLENRQMFSVMEPNNSLPSAVLIDRPGGFGGVMTVSDAITPFDTADYYKINAPVQFDQAFVAKLSGLAGDLNLALVHDINRDGIESANEVSVLSAKPGTADETVTRNLITALGTYYIRVSPATPGVTSNYTLNFSNDTALDTPNKARPLFANGAATVSDSIGAGDLFDVYKVQFNGRSNTGTFAARLTAGNPGNYHVDLYMDANKNGALDFGEMLTSSRPNGGGQEITPRLLSATNTYYLRVLHSASGSPVENYSLRTQMDYAGNTPVTAQFMGGPEGRIVSWPDQVGDDPTVSYNDSSDFFKFVVVNPGFTAVSQVNLATNQPAGMSTLRQELYQDKNKNNQIDAGELIGSASSTSGSATSLIKAAAGPGVYFVKITGASAPNYEFNFSLDGVKGITGSNPSFSNSKDLGTLTRNISWEDGLGAGDASDTYKIKVPENGNITFRLQEGFSQEQSPVEASLAFDTNGNGKRDAGETIALFDLKNPLTKALKAGTYYVTLAGGMHYGLELQATPDFAGGTANTAKNLGTLKTFASANDVLAPASNNVPADLDFYKFKLDTAQMFTANLVGYDNLANVTATLYKDTNGTLTQVRQVVGAPGGKAFLQTALTAGNYQIAFSVTGISIPYTVGFSAGDNDDSILEANVNPGSQLFSNGSKDFRIAEKTDVDMIRFLTAPGHRIAIDVDPRNGSKLNSYLRLFDAKGNQLASNDDGAAPGEAGSKFSYLSYKVPASSAEYVYVYAAVSSASNKSYNATSGEGDSGGGSTGDYRVTLTDLSGGVDSIVATSPFSTAPLGGGDGVKEGLFG